MKVARSVKPFIWGHRASSGMMAKTARLTPTKPCTTGFTITSWTHRATNAPRSKKVARLTSSSTMNARGRKTPNQQALWHGAAATSFATTPSMAMLGQVSVSVVMKLSFRCGLRVLKAGPAALPRRGAAIRASLALPSGPRGRSGRCARGPFWWSAQGLRLPAP